MAVVFGLLFLMSACGETTGQLADYEQGAVALGCVSMAGVNAVASGEVGTNCLDCSITGLEQAADGDDATSAGLEFRGAFEERGALRVTRPGEVFPAGATAGALASYGRVVSQAPQTLLRTYLRGELQEEKPFNDVQMRPGNEFRLYGFRTTKPFDAVEIASAGTNTGSGMLKLFEACSDVVIPPPFADVKQQGPTAVVADLSTGANPYHQIHRRPLWTNHPSTIIPGFPLDAPALELTFGPNLAANVEADRQKWLDMKPGVVYWIPGTNLLYVRTRYADEAIPGEPHDAPPFELAGHGTLTAGTISVECPDCYELIVADPEGGYAFSLDFIAQYAAWLDVAASTQQSIGDTPEAAPQIIDSFVVGPATGPFSAYAAAAKQWTELGRLYFIASGNYPVNGVGYPAPIPTADRSLPPWFTIIGGAYASCRASEANAGKPAEFVAEYRAQAPADNSMFDLQTVSGTSFSTPIVATQFARAVKRIRETLGDSRQPGAYWAGPAQSSPFLADGMLSRNELYEAFAQASELFETGEYSTPCWGAGIPVSATPWIEMGWGYIGATQADLAADLILGLQTVNSKPTGQAQFMEAWMTARQAAADSGP